MRIVSYLTQEQQTDPDNFPMMVAHPSLPPTTINHAREGLGLPEDVMVVLSPLCPPVQAFRINQMPGWEWVAR